MAFTGDAGQPLGGGGSNHPPCVLGEGCARRASARRWAVTGRAWCNGTCTDRRSDAGGMSFPVGRQTGRPRSRRLPPTSRSSRPGPAYEQSSPPAGGNHAVLSAARARGCRLAGGWISVPQSVELRHASNEANLAASPTPPADGPSAAGYRRQRRAF
jgi:hypothetical protein